MLGDLRGKKGIVCPLMHVLGGCMAECVKERCAWWDGRLDGCCMRVIADHLWDIDLNLIGWIESWKKSMKKIWR